MSADRVRRGELEGILPSLLRDATVTVLVPGPDLTWSVEVAWEAARTVARSGRRVALVDLTVPRGLLRTPPLGAEPAEGIVDAFLYGASLQRVVQQADVPRLFFIGAGSPAADPPAIWGHPRWERLARGFANQEALLALFVPGEGLWHLRLVPDRVVAFGAEAVPSLGAPVTRVVPDDPPVAAEPAITSSEDLPAVEADLRDAAGEPEAPARRRLSLGRVAPAGLVGIVALVAVVLLVRAGGGDAGPAPPPDTARGASPPAAPANGEDAPATPPQPSPPPAPASAAPAPVADTLFYAIQVASFKDRARALEYAQRYENAGWPVTLAPVRLGVGGVWHRVIVGTFSDPSGAETALKGFHDTGLLEPPSGTILRTPHALVVDAFPDADRAAAAAAGLREASLLPYIVEAPGTSRVLVGAFETPEQADLMISLLTTSGVTARLTLRTGVRP